MGYSVAYPTGAERCLFKVYSFGFIVSGWGFADDGAGAADEGVEAVHHEGAA